MKFALNAALTVGTLDGANIEIMEKVGRENFYIFGLKAEEIEKLRKEGDYNPWDYYNNNMEIKEIVDMLRNGFLSKENPDIFRPLYEYLMYGTEGNPADKYFVLADFEDYDRVRMRVNSDYKNKEEWFKKCIKNISNMGYFSSDRAIKEYAEEIWNTEPVKIEVSE